MDHAAQRPLRLHGPDGVRVGLGAVLVVAQDVSQACLVPCDVLPPAAPKTRTPGSAAVVEGHLVAVGVREREGAAERPVDGR